MKTFPFIEILCLAYFVVVADAKLAILEDRIKMS